MTQREKEYREIMKGLRLAYIWLNKIDDPWPAAALTMIIDAVRVFYMEEVIYAETYSKGPIRSIRNKPVSVVRRKPKPNDKRRQK